MIVPLPLWRAITIVIAILMYAKKCSVQTNFYSLFLYDVLELTFSFWIFSTSACEKLMSNRGWNLSQRKENHYGKITKKSISQPRLKFTFFFASSFLIRICIFNRLIKGIIRSSLPHILNLFISSDQIRFLNGN